MHDKITLIQCVFKQTLPKAAVQEAGPSKLVKKKEKVVKVQNEAVESMDVEKTKKKSKKQKIVEELETEIQPEVKIKVIKSIYWLTVSFVINSIFI
jgi:hypothetical protein